MRRKCEVCNSKLKRDDTVCSNCGADVYSNEFAELAREVEHEMKQVTYEQLKAVAADVMKYQSCEMSFEEFSTQYKTTNSPLYLHAHGILRLLLKSNYEKEIEQAYNDYLDRIRGN